MTDDVVITGIGIVSPIGCGEASFWDALCHGRSGSAPIKCLDTSKLSRTHACQVSDPIDAIAGASAPHASARAEPQSQEDHSEEHSEGPSVAGRASQLALAAARQAVAQAGIDVRDVAPGRLGITVGTTMGETQFIEDRLTARDEDWLSGEHMAQIACGKPGSIAGHVRSGIGADGQAADLYGACAAGNMALTMAARRIRDGDCDVTLAGGADGFSRLAFIGFMRLRVMSAGVCRPFDEQRDGLLVGEGSAMFVLERESSAKARGARIRARVLGGAMTSESYHPTRPDPEGDGLTRAAQLAMRNANVDAADIDYVCAHGTGTPQNDAIEVKVLDKCFPDGVAFSSIKALTGHCMGAAAAIETVCCVLTLEQQILIPTWHLTNLLQPCTLDAVSGATRPARVRFALNNSAGFGGYNSSVLLGAA